MTKSRTKLFGFNDWAALGFYHMQSAFDRDDYVKILWENITPGTEKNFNKYSNSKITYFNSTYGKL